MGYSFICLAVKKYLESIEDVVEVHDLHIWAMSTTETAMMVHLSMKNSVVNNQKLANIGQNLKKQFKI